MPSLLLLLFSDLERCSWRSSAWRLRQMLWSTAADPARCCRAAAPPPSAAAGLRDASAGAGPATRHPAPPRVSSSSSPQPDSPPPAPQLQRVLSVRVPVSATGMRLEGHSREGTRWRQLTAPPAASSHSQVVLAGYSFPGGSSSRSAGALVLPVVPRRRGLDEHRCGHSHMTRRAVSGSGACGSSGGSGGSGGVDGGSGDAGGSGSSSNNNSGVVCGSGSSGLASGVLSPALEARLRQLQGRCAQLEALLTGAGGEGEGSGGGEGGAAPLSPSALRDAGREYSRLKPLATSYEMLQRVRKELEDLGTLMRDPDPGVRAMAEEESEQLREQAGSLTRLLLLALVPRDPRDARPALLELRAGAGGLEAALFCGELLAMYHKFAQSRGWTWQVLEHAVGELGGVRHAVIAVSDERRGGGDGDEHGVYGILSPESGVHRVQRVPVTDTQGRVHTSTAAVIVLPQADEVDVRLREEDLRIETMRASGAGGQHVNVTDSAVRVTHVPTGLVVTCQNERSQHMNRASALKVLRSRLYDLEMQKRAREMDEQRSAVAASGERNERIRTYNYSQDRVTDHRIHVTLHDLASVLEGGEALERLMEALRVAREEEALRRLAEREGA